MIFGIGTDIVEIARIKKAITNMAFLKRCYNQEEIKRCYEAGVNAVGRFAGYFAAKEAVAKALGTGFRGFVPADIEIYYDDLKKPMARLADCIKIADDCKIFISISHAREYATAIAVISKE